MKKLYISMLVLMAFMLSGVVNAQTITVPDTFYLWKDTVKVSYEDPNFVSNDWIGIYRYDATIGTDYSVAWSYVPEDTGMVAFTGLPTGRYIAYLLCCDGYDIMAYSDTFLVLAPMLTGESDLYYKGDEMRFTYLSPEYSDNDWIGIYPKDSVPSDTTAPALIKEYLPDSAGVMTISSASLDSGAYVAYLLCCDGYEVLDKTNFSVYPNNALLVPESNKLSPGQEIIFTYNSPNYTSTDWIGIFNEGDDPQSATAVVWKDLPSKSGTIAFAGSLDAGKYVAYLLDISNNIIAQTDVIEITSDYLMVSAEKFLQGWPVRVNYKISDHQDKDWLAIYKEGDTPGGGASSVAWMYAPTDSGSVAFTDNLDVGDYMVYTLCCDGYNVIAKAGFSVVDASGAALTGSSISYVPDSTIILVYNDPNFSSTDWIGIYHPDDTPGDIASIAWSYVPNANDSIDFSISLPPGNYKAHLLCCDGYDIMATAYFIVADTTGATGVRPVREDATIKIYPNPASGCFNIETKDNVSILEISMYNLTGQRVLERVPGEGVTSATVSAGTLPKGMYLLEIRTHKGVVTKKIIIQ